LKYVIRNKETNTLAPRSLNQPVPVAVA
jgi:hypothetical protein